MKDKQPEIRYSEPVRELMGSPPGSILRWGTTVIFAVFVMFFIFAWIIQYPDFVPSPVEITTETPPVTLVSKLNGKINQLYVSDKDSVNKGQVLAVMETAADFSEIRQLMTFLDTAKNLKTMSAKRLPDLTRLGEVQNQFSLFRKSLSDLNNNVTNDLYGNRIESVKLELAGLNNYLVRLLEKKRLLTENLELETVNFNRMTKLLLNNAVSQADFDNSKQSLIRQKVEIQTAEVDISIVRLDIIKKQQLINEYSVTGSESYDKLYSMTDESFRNLKAEFTVWENRYLLVSPIAGAVTFTRYWKENQTVNENEPVLSIVPAEPGKYIGRITLKMQRSGKVTEGQTVNIKLSGFPYLEYGMVRGIIRSKSKVSSYDAYMIEIDLPDGLRTLYGRQLEFTQNMQGTAEIITNDRSLLEKMVSPFRHLVSISKK
jgi:multidrug efflux pump subunit AcrA (membrane-fusion protein)